MDPIIIKLQAQGGKMIGFFIQVLCTALIVADGRRNWGINYIGLDNIKILNIEKILALVMIKLIEGRFLAGYIFNRFLFALIPEIAFDRLWSGNVGPVK